MSAHSMRHNQRQARCGDLRHGRHAVRHHTIEHFITGADKDFHAFHAASAACPPRPKVVKAARAEHDKGRAVLVVTSREFIWRDLTLDWLVEHGIPYDALYMRIVGDYRKDVVIKKD